MILRLLNIQGIVGIAGALVLVVMLIAQKIETRHWRKQSGQFEQLYRSEQANGAQTVANYRAAVEAARVADAATTARVRAEQDAINERTADVYEVRLAAVRARAERLRAEAGTPATDPCGRTGPSMSAVPATACNAAQASGQDRLPVPGPGSDAALIATEQAIQLDELIRWVRAQATVDPNLPAGQPR